MSNTTTINDAVSFGEIVERSGAKRDHLVRHALNRLNIKPLRRAGASYLYPADAVDAVREDLRRRRPNTAAPGESAPVNEGGAE